MSNLDKLSEEIKKCQRCTLGKMRTQAVPGDGNPNSEILFIGEGPGKNEDEQGLPFVGAAGKFLNELLASIELKRKDVFIGNVVKCRPPGNRDPLPEEVEACWPYLEEQVKSIDPMIIVTLGRHAMDRFLPNQKISQIHGQPKRRNIPGLGKRIVYPIYHPAAALYNGSLRGILMDDFRRIPLVIKKIEETSAKREDKEEDQESLL